MLQTAWPMWKRSIEADGASIFRLRLTRQNASHIVAFALLLATFSSLADEGRTRAIHDATVLVDEGKVVEAIAGLKKLVADDPSDATAAYELGLAYAANGDNVNCRATLEPLAEAKSANRAQILGNSMIAIFVEAAGAEHDDFTSRVQTPFFTSMKKANVADTFAGIALSPLKLPGTETWARSHEKEISAYFDRVRPQLQRATVLLPE
jgi:thioredoxin-like negative regulator of GroEL